MYDTREEFQQKLQSCVVLYKGKPSLIRDVFPGVSKKDIILQHKLLRDSKVLDTDARDKSWDFRTLGSRLGYVNVDYGEGSYRQALYTMRQAVRQSSATQGLSQRNVEYPSLKPQPKVGLPNDYKVSWGDLYPRDWFLDTLERRYPTYQNTIEKIKSETVHSWAWHPRWCIYRPDVGPFYLLYKGSKVAYGDDPGYRWRLSPEFDHLRESLEDLRVKVA